MLFPITAELIKQVDALDVEQQLRLAIYLLEKARLAVRPARKNTAARAYGMLASATPAPSDAEVRQWLNERRLEKYG